MVVLEMKIRLGPMGVHLFDHETGLNVLFDEIDVPSHRWSLAPRWMSIALTNACDLECPYCYAPKSPGRLDVAHVLEWARELDANGCFGVGFGGGEPLLFPRLPELCQEIAGATTLSIGLTTHGHLMTGDLCSRLKGAVRFVRLSMDGVGDTYERLRGRPFRAFIERLQSVSPHIPFGINYVVNECTIVGLDEAARIVFGVGCAEMLLLPERNGGALAVGEDVMSRLTHWIETNRERYALAVSVDSVDALGVQYLPVCESVRGGVDYLHVDAQGVLKRSSFERRGVSIAARGSIMMAIEDLKRITEVGDEGLVQLR